MHYPSRSNVKFSIPNVAGKLIWCKNGVFYLLQQLFEL